MEFDWLVTENFQHVNSQYMLQQETAKDGMARLQSKFQNLKAKVNQG